MSTNPREMLAEAVKGKSDEEIIKQTDEMGGLEAVLDMTFEGMKAALNPDTAQDVTIGYELTQGDKSYKYALVIKDKALNVEKRDPSDARTTLGMNVPDYLRFLAGELDGMQAFMSGKLRVSGDLMFAQQIQTMFRVA